MAIRNILKDGEPTLRKRSREVASFDRRLHELLDDMAKQWNRPTEPGLRHLRSACSAGSPLSRGRTA